MFLTQARDGFRLFFEGSCAILRGMFQGGRNHMLKKWGREAFASLP